MILVPSQCGQSFDFNVLFSGRISYFTHPPETHTLPTHISAEIVTEMGKAFDWDELEKGNQEVLAGRNSHCTINCSVDGWSQYSNVNITVSESLCPDIQMGFCMENTGMTEGGQSDEYAMGGPLEEPEIKEETESMDDERDPEVGKLCTCYVCFGVVDWELETCGYLSLAVLLCVSNSLVQ